jgi:hypothetical protein
MEMGLPNGLADFYFDCVRHVDVFPEATLVLS